MARSQRLAVDRDRVLAVLATCHDACCHEREISVVDMGLKRKILGENLARLLGLDLQAQRQRIAADRFSEAQRALAGAPI